MLPLSLPHVLRYGNLISHPCNIKTSPSVKMKFLSLTLCLLVSLGSAEDLTPRNVLTCAICKEIITEIGKQGIATLSLCNLYNRFMHAFINTLSDEWITSDKTEQDIIDFFNQICLVRKMNNMQVPQNYYYLYCSGC